MRNRRKKRRRREDKNQKLSLKLLKKLSLFCSRWKGRRTRMNGVKTTQ